MTVNLNQDRRFHVYEDTLIANCQSCLVIDVTSIRRFVLESISVPSFLEPEHPMYTIVLSSM